MTTTPKLKFTYVEAAQSQKHVPVNENSVALDALIQCSILGLYTVTPPVSPSDGDRYIIGASATGAWAGKDYKLAYLVDGAWRFFDPQKGWIVFNEADNRLYMLNSSFVWVDVAAGAPITVKDTLFTLQDDADTTKQARFELSALSTGTTRVYTLPNATCTIATTSTVTQTFSGTTTFSGTFAVSAASASLGTSTAASTINVGTGANASGVSKTVNIGTSGASGSTTTINIGSATSGALGTTTLNSPTINFSSINTAINIQGTTTLAGSATTATLLYLGLGGATPDATNRFSINTPAVLLNNAGSGIDMTFNKNAAANDASLSFKTAFTSYAILGLLANNDFTIKVGTSFISAVSIDNTTGKTSLLTVNISPTASDPSTPVDGDVWYNSTGARLKARIDGRTMTLGDDEVPYLVSASSRYFVALTTPGTSTTTLAGVADRMNIYPFIPKFDFTANQLGINVTTAVASSLAKIVVYDSDENGRPDQRITETGDLDCSTTGAKTATVSIAFKKGKQYWLGVRTNSTQTISAFQPYTSPNLDMTSIATTQPKTLQRTLAYATATPASWTYVATEASTTSAPAIWFRSA